MCIICYMLLISICIFFLSDCRQVLLVSEVLVCIGILLSFHVLIPYSVPQYVGSALLTFVAAEVLEGNSLSRFGTIASLFCYDPTSTILMGV